MNVQLKITAFFGATAVGLGAFAAHGLKPILDPGQMETFKTGVLYHFVHVLVMLVLSLYANTNKVSIRSFYLFSAGIICFSGSLYVLSTKHLYGGDMWNFIGPITPVGGVLFILGWLNLALIKR